MQNGFHYPNPFAKWEETYEEALSGSSHRAWYLQSFIFESQIPGLSVRLQSRTVLQISFLITRAKPECSAPVSFLEGSGPVNLPYSLQSPSSLTDLPPKQQTA